MSTLVRVPPSDERFAYLLEVFELGVGRLGTGERHAVWLNRLKVGGYRWKCLCGAGCQQPVLDAALLAEARGHFDQAWEPPPVPIAHPAAIWNDRALRHHPPTTAELDQLARELSEDGDRPLRPGGGGTRAVEVVHRCGICGEVFQICPDDPHWSTGRGPICPEGRQR
jgi:hypothetical protein